MIIRRKKDKNFSVLCNVALKDISLSAKSKGIYAYVMSLPDDWKLYASELSNHFTDGRDSIASGLKELEEKGYLKRERSHDDKGLFKSYDYTFFESPQTDKPFTDNPKLDKPIMDNPTILNTDLNKELNKQNTNNTYSEDVIFIFDLWNSKGIRVHKKPESFYKIIKSNLKNYSFAEICSGINNYSEVLKDNEKFYFTHKWPLDQFLQRGLKNFVDDADPLNNYLSKKSFAKTNSPFDALEKFRQRNKERGLQP